MGECGIGNEERKGGVHNDHHHTFSKTFTMQGVKRKARVAAKQWVERFLMITVSDNPVTRGFGGKPNPDAQRPNMGKAGTLTTVAASKQWVWVGDIYSLRKSPLKDGLSAELQL